MKFTKKAKESNKWGQINEHYMTEESESDGGETIRCHKLPWRSAGIHKSLLKVNMSR